MNSIFSAFNLLWRIVSCLKIRNFVVGYMELLWTTQDHQDPLIICTSFLSIPNDLTKAIVCKSASVKSLASLWLFNPFLSSILIPIDYGLCLQKSLAY